MKHSVRALLGVVSALPFLHIALAQQSLWGPCGGVNHTGPTTCVSNSCCVFVNQWYSQCQPANGQPCSGAGTSTSTSSTTTRPTTTSTTTRTITSTTPVPVPTTTTSTTKTTSSIPTPSGTFTNPVIYGDFPDNDVSRGPDGAYYFSASNMHYSPGAPILKSFDLVNWEFIGHSLPTNNFGPENNMQDGTTKYLGGSWASTLRYRESEGKWYWIGCISFWNTYIYTAPSPTGPWTQHSVLYGNCYYDCGLLIDDDDTMYVVYGGSTVSIAQLSADGKSQVKTEQLITSPPGTSSIEGNRLYKRNGVYYVLNDYPGGGTTIIWKSASIWGPWEYKYLHQGIPGPVAGGNSPHQGSLIQTPEDKWYFMSFTWAYPVGRMPVLAPVTWGSDGYPILGLTNGTWGKSYPNPLPLQPTPSWLGTDNFQGTSLSVHWEWNHNPDATKYSVNNGVTLNTVTVTNDLYKARNTLTHRVIGEFPVATIKLDFTNLADGDRAGLAAFRDHTGYIGVTRAGNTYTLVTRHSVEQNPTNWSTANLGTDVATQNIAKGTVWLRGSMDSRASGTKLVTFSYSLDGNTFTPLGGAYTLNSDWRYFPGYRWGIFNYAEKAVGGSVKVISFTQS